MSRSQLTQSDIGSSLGRLGVKKHITWTMAKGSEAGVLGGASESHHGRTAGATRVAGRLEQWVSSFAAARTTS